METRRLGNSDLPITPIGIGVRKTHGVVADAAVISAVPPAGNLFFLLVDWLNLHELPAEPTFDAKIAMGHAIVERRGHANDLAFLLVDGEIATYAAIRTDGVSLGLAAFVPSAGLAHVIFALEHQRARGADADAVAAIDASRVGKGNVKFSGNVGGEAATCHCNCKGVLRVYAARFHAFVAQNALGVVADVKLVVNFYRLGDCGAGCAEALRMRAVPVHIRLHRGRRGKVYGRSQKFQQ
jgi:hypothetical protein